MPSAIQRLVWNSLNPSDNSTLQLFFLETVSWCQCDWQPEYLNGPVPGRADTQITESWAPKDDDIQYSEFLAAMMASRIALHDELLKDAFRTEPVCRVLLVAISSCLPACLPLFLSFVLSCSFYFLIIYRSFLLSYYFSLAFWLVQMMNWQHLTATVVTEGCRLGVNWLLGFLGSCCADWSLEFA